jgi:hypothetical protein
MKAAIITTACIVALLSLSATASRRVEVYSLSREYWDVRPGETLSSIAAELLPGDARRQQQLQRDIMHLNPHAFIAGRPSGLIARQRLWLPNAVTRPVVPVYNQPNIEIERFNWGYIKRFD